MARKLKGVISQRLFLLACILAVLVLIEILPRNTESSLYIYYHGNIKANTTSNYSHQNLSQDNLSNTTESLLQNYDRWDNSANNTINYTHMHHNKGQDNVSYIIEKLSNLNYSSDQLSFTKTELKQAFDNQIIVMIGDSTLRSLSYLMVNILSHQSHYELVNIFDQNVFSKKKNGN